MWKRVGILALLLAITGSAILPSAAFAQNGRFGRYDDNSNRYWSQQNRSQWNRAERWHERQWRQQRRQERWNYRRWNRQWNQRYYRNPYRGYKP